MATIKDLLSSMIAKIHTKVDKEDFEALGDNMFTVDLEGAPEGDGEIVLLNADLLGGKAADNFATKDYVSAKIADAQLGGGESGDIDLSGFMLKTDTAVNSDKLGGKDASEYALKTSLDGKLGKTEQAADSAKLGGADADSYALKTDTAPNAEKLGGKAPEYYLQPRNLLDNSYFRKLVNQRGANGTFGAWGGYTIDRWAAYANGATIGVTDDGLSLQNAIFQAISAEDMSRFQGKWLTFAVKINGVVYVACGLFEQTDIWHMVSRTDTPYGYICIEVQNDNKLFCVIDSSISATTVEWACLYEGAYTAETLPPYVPKGYSAELLECQRYYYKFQNGTSVYGYTGSSGTSIYLAFELPTIMRLTNPTVSMSSNIYGAFGGAGATSLTSISSSKTMGKQFELVMSLSSGLSANTVYAGWVNGTITVSADL